MMLASNADHRTGHKGETEGWGRDLGRSIPSSLGLDYLVRPGYLALAALPPAVSARSGASIQPTSFPATRR